MFEMINAFCHFSAITQNQQWTIFGHGLHSGTCGTHLGEMD